MTKSPFRSPPAIRLAQNRCLYHVPIACASRPKRDNEVSSSFLPRFAAEALALLWCSCHARSCANTSMVYRNPETGPIVQPGTIPGCASAAELRVAFKLRGLELTTAGVPRS